MSTCSHCGAEYAEGSRFCPECGRALVATCPTCGQSVQPGSTFCGNCGERLANQAAIPQASEPVTPSHPQMARPKPTPNGATTPSTPPPRRATSSPTTASRPASPSLASASQPTAHAVPLAYAPLNDRIKAWLIDTGLLAIAVVILFSPLIATGGDAGGAFVGILLWLTIVSLIYFTVVEMAGTTIGKAIVGLQIVDENGQAPGPIRSLIRNALRFIDFLPLFYLFGYITANSSPTRQRLGDLVARTYVILRRS